MINKKKHGGSRKGAGRKKVTNSKFMRIPLQCVAEVEKIIKPFKQKYVRKDMIV